jgi:hypothetical protein
MTTSIEPASSLTAVEILLTLAEIGLKFLSLRKLVAS